MENLLILGGVVAAWVILVRFVFPRLGIQG